MWKCYSEDQKILKKFIPMQYILKIKKSKLYLVHQKKKDASEKFVYICTFNVYNLYICIYIGKARLNNHRNDIKNSHPNPKPY